MSLPSIEKLAELYVNEFDLACNTTPGTSLAAMSEEEEERHVDASRETAIAAVRDAVLDGLIAEAGESRAIYYEFNLRPGSEREQRLADWLRTMKGTP